MRLVALAIVAALLSGTAHAQLNPTQETGSRIYTQPRDSDDPARAARYSKVVAGCVYRRMGPEPVDEFLRAGDPVTIGLADDSFLWSRMMRLLEECMDQRHLDYNADVRSARLAMSFTPGRLRALLQEEAYLGEQDQGAIVIPQDAGELTLRQYVSTGEDATRARGVGNFSDCIVHRDAAGADALLRTQPASAEEDRAARSLAPVLGTCLIQGQTIEFTPASIRAMAADGLWSRLVYGSQPSE